MKKWICILLLVFLAGCAADEIPTEPSISAGTEVTTLPTETQSSPDIDLTAMSGTMVYSQVLSMMMNPSDYLNQTVRMQGSFSMFHDDATDTNYYACLIADATSCCSQGLEFVLADSKGYPQLDDEITVSGTFQTYNEDGAEYCHLVDAVLE